MAFNVEEKIQQLYGRKPIKHVNDITLWKKWYQGYVEDFHKYMYYNGVKDIALERMQLGAAKTVCESWANLIANEKTYANIPNGEKTKDDDLILQSILEDTMFFDKLNNGVELTFALGGGCFQTALLNGVKNKALNRFDEKISNGKIQIEYINAEKTYVLKRRYGEVIDIALVSVGDEDANVTIHRENNDGTYTILDTFFSKDKSRKDENWIIVNQEKTIVECKWFSYVKPNIVNNKDVNEVQGISVFANAIDQLKSCDIAYDGYTNEIELSKKRMFVSASLTVTEKANGEVQEKDKFDPKDKLIYVIPSDMDGDNVDKLIATNSSPLRASEYEKALNGALAMLSMKTGFGKNYFVFNTDGSGRPIQTATAVISQNSDLYRSLKKHEKIFGNAIKEIVRAICDASRYTSNKISKVYSKKEVQVLFDDSIIEDKQSEKTTARQEVSQGLMSAIEYREEFFGENEETARKNLLNNPEYVAILLAKLEPSLKDGTLTVEKFVEIVYGNDVENKEEIVNQIKERLKENQQEFDLSKFSGTL